LITGVQQVEKRPGRLAVSPAEYGGFITLLVQFVELIGN